MVYDAFSPAKETRPSIVVEDSKKELSTSSFYNNLKTLKQRGLVEFIENKKGKVEFVKKTQETEDALKSINNYFLQSTINKGVSNLIFSENIFQLIGLTQFDTLFLVLLQKHENLDFLKIYSKISKQFFILSNIETLDELLMDYQKEINNYHRSQILGGLIREPNNIFDAAIFPEYSKNLNFFNLDRAVFLKELIRVTKKGGIVVLISKTEMPLTDNELFNELIKVYNEVIKTNGADFTKEEMEKDMKDAGIAKTNIKIVTQSGLLIGIGKV